MLSSNGAHKKSSLSVAAQSFLPEKKKLGLAVFGKL